jgi:hypothetical protein
MKGCDSYLWDFYSQVYIAFSVVISIFFFPRVFGFLLDIDMFYKFGIISHYILTNCVAGYVTVLI